ncbi:hypothetical protein Entcl_0899 [[Enterobacter] lignolyticus SCF1]|uniref:Uncharacterized protein n=1 Tax=Enterobacter lignolyticus (strain SCF1) TaxID=701347 RepID=E3G522_ENTLS|nr:hypothetical protein Entcl_0899 [[Enterobacter] lignolyticus SCF1]
MLSGVIAITEWFTVSGECETIIHIEDYFEVVR